MPTFAHSKIKFVEAGFGVVLVLLALVLCQHPAPANDLFWQLRAGLEILTGHGIPHHDSFSWTRSNAPWVAHEWLTFTLFAWLYHGWGFGGIWLLQWLLSVIIILTVYYLVLRETDHAALLAFGLTAGAALIAGAFFEPRPQLFTYLFLVVTLGILLQARRSQSPYRSLLLLPPIYVLWSNLHAGVLVGLSVILLCTMGDTLCCLWVATPSNRFRAAVVRSTVVLPLMVTGLLCGLSTLCTPYTWHVYDNMRATLGNSTAMDLVVEWASPNFHGPEGKNLEILLVIALGGILGSRLRRDVVLLTLFGVLTHWALYAYRNVPLLALAGVVLIAPHVQSALNGFLGDYAARSASAPRPTIFTQQASPGLCALVALLFFALWALQLVVLVRPLRQQRLPLLEALAHHAMKWDDFPEAACRFLEAQHFPAGTRIFNEYDDGGYLIWRLPQYPVFIDGRADVYFGGVLEDYMRIHSGQQNWRQLLRRYSPDIMVLHQASVLARFVQVSPEWKPVFTSEPSPSTLHTALHKEPECWQVFVRSDWRHTKERMSTMGEPGTQLD